MERCRMTLNYARAGYSMINKKGNCHPKSFPELDSGLVQDLDVKRQDKMMKRARPPSVQGS